MAIAPLLWLLDRSGPWRGALLGFVFGLGFYGATIYWIWRFGELAWVALTVVMALSLALFGALDPAIRRPGRPVVYRVRRGGTVDRSSTGCGASGRWAASPGGASASARSTTARP